MSESGCTHTHTHKHTCGDVDVTCSDPPSQNLESHVVHDMSVTFCSQSWRVGSSCVGSPVLKVTLVPRHGVVTELSVLVFHKLKGDKLHRALELLPMSTSGAQPLTTLTKNSVY